MKHKDLDYVVIAATLFCGGYTALTGLVMDLLNMPLPVFHDYAGYACTVLAGVHIVLNWKKMAGYLKHRAGSFTRNAARTDSQ
jgi:hypothetical protein